jgi:hypothetical protein
MTFLILPFLPWNIYWIIWHLLFSPAPGPR